MNTAQKKFTLLLPEVLYEKVRQQAEKQGTSIKEIFRQYLKLGLIASEIEEDENTDLIIRERVVTGYEDDHPIVETSEQVLRLL
jgi:hypothetical protein